MKRICVLIASQPPEDPLISAAATDAAKASEHRARAVIENAYDAFIGIDASGAIVDWNSRAESMFGWSRAEVLGVQLSQTIIPLQYREAHERGLKHFLSTGEGPIINRRIEVTAVHHNGREFPVELAVFIVDSANPTFGAFIRDISERKAAEEALLKLSEELQRSNADLQHFAFIAAHDLREPLRTISSFTELLRDQLGRYPDPDVQENVRFISGAAKRMQQLVDGLLAYSRVETRGQEFEFVDCNELVDRVISLLKVSIDEAGATVTRDDLPVVKGDAAQLEQLIANLLNNAIKFRSIIHAPFVHIGVKREDSLWRFSIRDNGIGIETEHAERIFDMFQRLHTQDEYSGTGMGLAICRRIIGRHGGQIWLEAQPDEGSTFHFTILVDETTGRT